MTRPLRRVLVAVMLSSLLIPVAAAEAKPNLFSVMMDDDVLVYRDDTTRDRALQRMQSLGVDVVRVTLLWSVVADEARDTKAKDRRFKQLKASNPKAYPKLNWDRYDRLVRAAQRLGIRVYFNITGPGPKWGHAKAPASQKRNAATWKPKPSEFYKFVQAVGKRYSGQFKDENDGRFALPRVSMWSIWNEPNQAGWLSPQWEDGKPSSAIQYRKLYDYGYRGLVSTGHASDAIMIGETAPLGVDRKDARSPMRPKEFIRSMYCVDDTGAPLGGDAAAALGCSWWDRKKTLPATWWAHHPYTKNVGPTVKDKSPDSLTMANIEDLPNFLDAIGQKTGRVKTGIDILSAEFGFETNPPDKYSGVPMETQATWINQGELQAFLSPRIIGQTQFLLYDVGPRTKNSAGSKAYWSTYQSGLFTRGDQAKPALTAYRQPLLVFPTGQVDPATNRPTYTLWGALRFRPEAVEDVVSVDWKPADGSADWAPITEAKTNQTFQASPTSEPVKVVEGYFYLPTFTTPGPGKVRVRFSVPQPPYVYTSREFDLQ
ncbi:hypothetical protein [Conexibacter sp. SYSU D00693]|uniref:hypothetical protein n=1 Tax=Conexibacter sp. SYSU D00693 TaxID=2812560 RepID=UPI00196AB95A|nr:hypothetical protein [Conexibacter sp. SYSU D00693]